MSCGAEGWTVRQQDIHNIDTAEMWLYRRLLKLEDKRTNVSILEENGAKREKVSIVMKRERLLFGHAVRNKKCTL